MYVTIITLNKKDKLLIKVDGQWESKALDQLKKSIIKAYDGEWVMMPDFVKLEKLI